MSTRRLTRGQKGVLGVASGVMVAVGVAGAIGTYSNALAEFARQATAAGVVAAGEGLTLILALTMVGLTLLGQAAPPWVRIGLWLAPLAACGTGLSLADNLTEAVVYSVMPLGMSGAAEGLGLIARRIVIYTTGVDAEAQRRNAATLQRLAYHRARSANHPGEWTRKRSERTAWRLARHIGAGDSELGADLIDVQRAQLTAAGDAALADMFSVTPAPTVPKLPQAPAERLDHVPVPAVEAPRPRPVVVPADARLLPVVARPTPSASSDQDDRDAPVPPFPTPVPPGARLLPLVPRPALADHARRDTHGTADTQPVTGLGTQVSAPADAETGTADTDPAHPVTLADLAAVTGVPEPVPGEPLTDAQLGVVLRHLRYTDDPPRSYRQARLDFRDSGFVGSEERVRREWAALLEREKAGPAGE